MVARNDHDRPVAVAEETDGLRVTVTELPETVFGHLNDACSHHAFERGYHVAITETIASLLPATEAFLRSQTSNTPALRDAFYQFERFLARRLDISTRAENWVEGGGGI